MKTKKGTPKSATRRLPKALVFDEKLFVELFVNEICRSNPGALPAVGDELYASEAVCDSVDIALKNLVCGILRIKRQAQGVGEIWLFGMLRFEEFRNLKPNPLLEVFIAEAIKHNECGFFVRLGAALAKKSDSIVPAIQSYKIQLRIITSWISRDPEALGLCDLSDEQITDYLQNAFPRVSGINMEAVRQKWRRLGLKKGKLFKQGRIVPGPTNSFILKEELGKWTGKTSRKQ